MDKRFFEFLKEHGFTDSEIASAGVPDVELTPEGEAAALTFVKKLGIVSPNVKDKVLSGLGVSGDVVVKTLFDKYIRLMFTTVPRVEINTNTPPSKMRDRHVLFDRCANTLVLKRAPATRTVDVGVAKWYVNRFSLLNLDMDESKFNKLKVSETCPLILRRLEKRLPVEPLEEE
jgi:hypothetical protein